MSKTRKLRVLIADDETHCRALLRAVLTSMDCEVVGEAKTGAEAVELYRSLRPHMMLLDINMPMKTGDEVLTDILGEFPNALIVVLTSIADSDHVERCLEIGASNYVRKDTSLTEIKQIIIDTWKAYVETRMRTADKIEAE